MKKTTQQIFRVFWSHSRKYRGWLIFMWLAVTAAVVVETIVPLQYKKFFDTLSQDQPAPSQLFHWLYLILGLNAIVWVLLRSASYVMNYVRPHIMIDLAETCFSYLQGHSYRFFANRFVGSLVRRLNRLVDSFDSVAMYMYWELYPLFLRIALILGILAWNYPWIALLIAVWCVVYLGSNYALTIYKLRFDAESAKADSEWTAQLSDAMTNSLTIKLFSAQALEQQRFRSVLERWLRIALRNWNIDDHIESIQFAFLIALEFAVFLLGVRFWQQGTMGIGDFVLLQAYLLQIFTRLWNFGRTVRDLYRHLANAEEMIEVLNLPHEVADRPGAPLLHAIRGDIVFQHVNFGYQPNQLVLRDLDLHIQPGEKVGIVGASGAGKSTLTNLLLRFVDVSSGKIMIDGQDIATVTQNSLRQAISLVPQDPILFHRSLLENIRYGNPEASRAEVLAAAAAAYCDEFIRRLPQGYDTLVGERGIKLSGGERQRIAIARAFLKRAPIVVLDEATSSLDSQSEAYIQAAFKSLMHGKTTLVIAHRLATIIQLDRIIVFAGGTIVGSGTHAELLAKNNGIYYKLWNLQAGGFLPHR